MLVPSKISDLLTLNIYFYAKVEGFGQELLRGSLESSWEEREGEICVGGI